MKIWADWKDFVATCIIGVIVSYLYFYGSEIQFNEWIMVTITGIIFVHFIHLNFNPFLTQTEEKSMEEEITELLRDQSKEA